MKLTLKNIGSIRDAAIEINGITVIAGENNTGKSTVSRALFTAFNGFYQIEDKIQAERINEIQRLLMLLSPNSKNRLTTIRISDIQEISKNILNNIDFYGKNAEALKNDLITFFSNCDETFKEYANDAHIDSAISRINAALAISDLDLMKFILEKKLIAEFNGQFSNIFANEAGEITLELTHWISTISVKNNHVIDIKNDSGLDTEALYLDNPLILDEVQALCQSFIIQENNTEHSEHLMEKIRSSNNANLVEEITVNHKLEAIYHKLANVCNGDIVKDKDKRSGFQYKKFGSEEKLDVRNLSTGLKAFAIIEILLRNGSLDYNGTMILDEPEIHLHPEWQLLFAELIVLIHKEFNMHILINTHSPYFLNAIEVYTMKYDVDNNCKYYLSSTKNEFSYLEDVTEHIESIYSKLARPLQLLENERHHYD